MYMFVPRREHAYGPPRNVIGLALLFLYVDDVRTSLEARTTTVLYRDSLTFSYVDDIPTSQETWTTTILYRDSFTFLYVDDFRISQKHY
jgi:hypothetical protein